MYEVKDSLKNITYDKNQNCSLLFLRYDKFFDLQLIS